MVDMSGWIGDFVEMDGWIAIFWKAGWMDGYIFQRRMDGSKQGGRTSYPRPTPVIPLYS